MDKNKTYCDHFFNIWFYIFTDISNRTCADVINPKKYRNSSGQSIFHLDADDIENCTCLVNFELKEPLNVCANEYALYIFILKIFTKV